MKRTEYRCDRCGALIDDDRHALQCASGSLRFSLNDVDLCVGCAGALREWLAGGVADGQPTVDGGVVNV